MLWLTTALISIKRATLWLQKEIKVLTELGNKKAIQGVSPKATPRNANKKTKREA
jgi:hypothetical protein